ncbi:MAG: autotransporter domain-containing protein, partial [Akkermansia sp.]|nr:autotransporter domain-containing protein [Akkermansia sp.]
AAGVEADSLSNLRAEVGVGATYAATAKTSVYGEVSFIGDTVRDNPATHLGGTCRGGANPGRAGMNLSVGATHALNESWSVNAGYTMELVPHANSHSANIGATYRF